MKSLGGAFALLGLLAALGVLLMVLAALIPNSGVRFL